MESRKQYHNRMIKESTKIQTSCKHDYTFLIMGDHVCKCGKIQSKESCILILDEINVAYPQD
jgi:hypothetical protein